jgi:pectinesterase
MCSNALAMIKNMTDTDVANEFMTTNRKLMQEKEVMKVSGRSGCQ